MSVDKDRLQAQTDRNGNVQRQPPLRRRYDLARRKMENDIDMKTAFEMPARGTKVRSNGNRMIARLTPIVPRDALAEIGIVAFWNGVSGRSPIDPKPNVAYGDGGKWEIMFTGGGDPILVPPPSDYEKVLEALTFCTQDIFSGGKGWRATAFRAMSRSENGVITFEKGKQKFSVETGNDFTTDQLKQIANQSGENSKIYGVTFPVGHSSQVTHFGRTIRTDPTTTNYVGNEMNGWGSPLTTDTPSVQTFGNVLATQIHELGHSLMARFLNQSDYHNSERNSDKSWDQWRKEIGWQYEKCVYDRYVGNR